MNRNKYRTQFIVLDFIASGITWTLFYLYRKFFVETLKYGTSIPLHLDLKFYISLLVIPVFWFLLNYSFGSYSDFRQKKQSTNTLQLFLVAFLGSFIIFFTLLLDDSVVSYVNYYISLAVLFSLQFAISLGLRSILIACRNHIFKTKKDCFRVLAIGTPESIEKFTIKNHIWIQNNYFQIVSTSETSHALEHLDKHFTSQNIEEVFIINGNEEFKETEALLLKLFRQDLNIRISPELYPITNIPVTSESLEDPLLLLSNNLVKDWQRGPKILLDIFVSVLALIILLPLIALLALIIKVTSRGPIIYSHQRIGKNGKPFDILKFRSMYLESEPNGPQLSSRDDKRITPIGRFMRKRRLDEIPNFINVIKGEMSLVGPRPERRFYIDQIIQKAPQYTKLHLVKPGITSWGQVKFGYAESIDEMIQRMRYDLVYIQNVSFYTDIRIMLWTIRTIFKGKGV